jgi:hypothetical protein
MMERYLDLVSLMLTSADLILSRLSDKGTNFDAYMLKFTLC